jgi:hypothetical protein
MFGLTLPAMGPLEAAALWEANLLHGPELEHQAVGWVERGIETEAALSLAFEVPEPRHEATRLVKLAMQEVAPQLNIDMRQLGWIGARFGLQNILDKLWPPFKARDGC